MVLPKVPKSAIVVGAGAIGVEFADFWNAFGVDVTIVEAMPRIVPVEDEDVSATLERALKKKGIKIHTGARVEATKVVSGGVETTITLANGKTEVLTTEKVLSAVGVQANIEGIGLEGMGVTLTDRNFIKIDTETYETTSPGIYAIGDVAGPPMLAHKAMVEAIACVERLAGKTPAGVNYDVIPGCTYCTPEVASVGMTEAKAREAGINISVGKFPFAASGKALGAGKSDGFIKVITDKDNHQKVVGIHAIGHGVTDIIAEISLAMTSEATAHDILAAVHPHPTLSEAVMEATAAALGEAVHI